MSREPMKVLPEDLFPPDVKTPEERVNHLGRKLFAADPEEVRQRQEKSGPKAKPQDRPRSGD